MHCREQWLREAHYNVFMLKADQVYIDCLTDSGTGAMSDRQWSAMMLGDESYAGASSFYKFEAVVQRLFGFKYVIPTHQGRAAENVLFSYLVKAGQVVPGNAHFDTTKGHIEFRKAQAVDVTIDEARDTQLELPFKGNVSLEKLERLLRTNPGNVPFMVLTVTNNTVGGQPVSMQNIRETSALCHRYNVPVVMDSARFAENAYFIKTRENGYADKTIKEIALDYYVNFVPYFVNMFSPLFVFITVIFFTSRMAGNSEFIAMLSGGISYRRILMPYIFSSIFIALLSLGLNLYVIPNANAKRSVFEQKYINHKDKTRLRNVHYQIAPGEFVYVESFSKWNNTAYKFSLETIKDNRIVSKLEADSAVWDSTMDGWKLRNWFIRDYGRGLEDKVRGGTALDTVIALKITDFYRNEKTVETLSIKQLNELIDTQNMRGDANVMFAEIEKHTRYALPFSAIILTIMGVCLSSRKRRGGIGWNLALGIALAFSYILFLRFSQMFVYTGTLPPMLALWTPNILYALITVFLYTKAQK